MMMMMIMYFVFPIVGPLPPGGGGGGYSPIKVTEVLVVPFRGLNLWIGIA